MKEPWLAFFLGVMATVFILGAVALVYDLGVEAGRAHSTNNREPQ